MSNQNDRDRLISNLDMATGRLFSRGKLEQITNIVLEEVENGIIGYQPFTPAEAIKVIDNMRGNGK